MTSVKTSSQAAKSLQGDVERKIGRSGRDERRGQEEGENAQTDRRSSNVSRSSTKSAPRSRMLEMKVAFRSSVAM